MTSNNTTNAFREESRLSAAAVFAKLDEDRAEDSPMRTRLAAAERPTWAEGITDTRKKPWLIGLFSTTPDLPNAPHPFFGPVLTGIKIRTVAANCDLLITTHRPDFERGPDLDSIARCRRYGVDGLIVMGIASTDADFESVVGSGLPSIFIDYDALGPRSGYVMSNNLEGMASAVRHLYSLGRRRIATITGMMNTRPGIDRLLGYRSELARLGLAARDDYVVKGDFYHRSGFEETNRLLALEERPDAIAAASDMMAVGAIVAIENAGLRVPDDIAVTGYDDAGFAGRLRPSLTTIRQDAVGLGIAAADGILTMLDLPEGSPPTILLPTELVVRESCGLELRSDARQRAGLEALA
jgi:LacI family transcriptional regulator